MQSWLRRTFCTMFGHRFGVPRADGVVLCGRCGLLAYGVRVTR